MSFYRNEGYWNSNRYDLIKNDCDLQFVLQNAQEGSGWQWDLKRFYEKKIVMLMSKYNVNSGSLAMQRYGIRNLMHEFFMSYYGKYLNDDSFHRNMALWV